MDSPSLETAGAGGRGAPCSFSLLVPKAFVVFYLVYTWGNEEFEKSKRKNPAAYEHDK